MVEQRADTTSAAPVKFVVFSLIGVLALFTPIPHADGTTIPIDLVATWLSETLPTPVRVYVLLMVLAGALYPFLTRTWNKNRFELIFTALKLLAVPVAVLVFLGVGPAWLLDPDMGPFLFDVLLVSVGLIVPLGGLILAFLTGYGLLEFLGVLTQRIMRPAWRVPGRSSVNALASYVASLVVGLLITNKEYVEGRYSFREAVVIATGFSTVAAPFLVVVASVLNLMDLFFTYFIVTFLVTALVTAITVRLWPISKLPDAYAVEDARPEEQVESNYVSNAWSKALTAAATAPPVGTNIWTNFRQAIVMTFSVLPAILSIGLIGLVLVEHTPVFDYIAYVFYPLMWALQIPDPWIAAVAAPIGITEMLLPAIVAAEAELITRFIIGVFCVSQIVFFATSVPAILATDIPVRVWQLLIIWLERTILTFVVTTPIAYLLL